MEDTKYYSWDANDYAKQSANQHKWARELIARLNLQGNEHILDIGCGDGKVTAEIAEQVPNGVVLGIDNSLSMIELAQKAFPSDKYSNLSFKNQDARDFSCIDRYDIVFSNAVLHWVIDHRPVLKNIYNCLKPGGRILLQMGGKGNAAGILSVLDEIFKANEWKAYFKNFEFPYGFHGVEKYKTWLTNCNFVIKRVELIPKDMTHPDQKGLEGWIRTTWLPYTQRVPSAQREEFIHSIANLYIKKQKPRSDGKIHVDMVRLEVAAERPVN